MKHRISLSVPLARRWWVKSAFNMPTDHAEVTLSACQVSLGRSAWKRL